MTGPMIDALCQSVDGSAMTAHLEEFATRVKLSGSPAERESFHYLQRCLTDYGYCTELILHPAYISLPGPARLAAGHLSPRCITHSFSRSSPPAGLHGGVVAVGSGSVADFAACDVRGRIVLVDGMATPAVARRASLAGASGQIHVSPHEHLHEMCISPVWGSPGADTADQLPSTVIVSIAHQDGAALKARLAADETVTAVLHAEVDTGWRETPILVAELMPDGAAADAPFVMFSGHHDTWHFGVMDNGGANATMLEVARLMAPARAHWQRGLRLCFWSGHSHGRYSGSAWYADNNWSELARRCAVHVNVDSTGAMGNTVLADAPASAELVALAREAVGVRGGQAFDGLRMGRAGDQSFWGIGVPSLFMTLGEQPAATAGNVAAGVFGGGTRKGAGLGWWWHTPDDTLDKMDLSLLVRDTRIYVHAVGRLLTDPVLPLDYAAHADYLLGVLRPLQRDVGDRLDMAELLAAAEALAAAARAAQDSRVEPAALNRALLRASRALVPVDYTTGDRFGHDPALPQNPIPLLDAVRALVAAPEPGFLAVTARRACNQLCQALEEARTALNTATTRS